jgi:hypothetical protein
MAYIPTIPETRAITNQYRWPPIQKGLLTV